MEPTNSFLTAESLATFGGTTLATLAVSNTYRSIFNKDPKIIAVILSIAICLFLAYNSGADATGYVIAFVNGCLVYCSAFGLNNQINRTSGTTETPEPEPAGNGNLHAQPPETPGKTSKPKRFFHDW